MLSRANCGDDSDRGPVDCQWGGAWDAALFELGRPFRLIMYEGADHGLTEFRGEAHGEIRRWLDRYVRDREELPELAPHEP